MKNDDVRFERVNQLLLSVDLLEEGLQHSLAV
jgi:hypothetical protein